MEVGIVGLPVSGKTTLFSTLTGQSAGAFGGGKVEVHRGIVKVPDPRLDELTNIFNPKKKVPATIEYIEVGGMEGDQSKGFDPQFLQVLKNTDALCVIIRAFENEFYPHPMESVDPVRDIQIVEAEFLLSDLAILESRIERLKKQMKKIKEDHHAKELALLERCQATLEEEVPLRELDLNDEERTMLRGYQFLSLKPVVFAININETDISREQEIAGQFPDKMNVKIVTLCAKAEEEISQLAEEDREMFLEEMGIVEPAFHKLIRISYDLLGLIAFFTVGEDECRAWTVRSGAEAPKAAGVIHSDMERGFIRSEVVSYDDFMTHKSLSKCKDNGVFRLEGKSYVVQDGDIMSIRFNV